ncbi:MAG: NYN domain-containing protein, partial [Promethearchaeota archaeon]
PIVVAGDTDVYMSIEAMDLIYSDELDIVAFWTSDINFLPIFIKAKELGKETVVLGRTEGFSETLENAADFIVILAEETILTD